MLVVEELDMNQHCALAAQKANCILSAQKETEQQVEGGDSLPLVHSH